MPPSSGISTTSLDKVRARIAYLLLGIFAATVALVIALDALGQAGATVIGAEVILLRAVLSFYFARRDDR